MVMKKTLFSGLLLVLSFSISMPAFAKKARVRKPVAQVKTVAVQAQQIQNQPDNRTLSQQNDAGEPNTHVENQVDNQADCANGACKQEGDDQGDVACKGAGCQLPAHEESQSLWTRFRDGWSKWYNWRHAAVAELPMPDTDDKLEIMGRNVLNNSFISFGKPVF